MNKKRPTAGRKMLTIRKSTLRNLSDQEIESAQGGLMGNYDKTDKYCTFPKTLNHNQRLLAARHRSARR